ncbi:MAG: choice-of-anchor J domain-containing protein [Bacteroidales bacterium]|nr:choice-of-anchor J domain-containing protein [Bacteroidales bacterium]
MKKIFTASLLFIYFILSSGIGIAQTNSEEYKESKNLIEIGTEAHDDLGLPMEPFYHFTYTQSLFLQNELNISGKRIEKIYYHYNGNSAWEQDIVIYMGHTDSVKFTTRNSWIGFSELTEVFNGKMTVSDKDEWIEIILTKPFNYDNVNNLVIAFDENTDEYFDKDDEFFCSSTTDTLSLRRTDDFENPDPVNPPESDLDGTLAYRPNIRIQFADVPTTPKITIPVTSFEFHLREAMTKDSAYVEVYNTGIGDLVISGITSIGEHYYSTYSGTIPEGERDTVLIYYYPQSEGTHNDTLSFTSNTTLEDPVIIVTGEAYPYGLEVPTVAINDTYYYFAKIHENDSSFTENIFELQNDSTGTLKVLSFTGLDGTEFSTNLDTADVALSGDDVYSFGFTYKPVNPGQDTIIFTMQTNGGDIEFYMVGNAVPENYNIENFEGTVFPPEDWIIVDADVDYENWTIGAEDNPYTGMSALSWSYDMAMEEALTPDNWLITPKLKLSGDDSLTYLCRAPNEHYFQEYYSVMLSAGGTDISDFTETLFSERLDNDAWNYRSVDLSAYSGQEVYIAFRHHNSTNQSALRIDEISFPQLASEATSIEATYTPDLVNVYPNPTTGILNITNVENSTISIYSITGSLLQVYENAGMHEVIDISSFNEGVYIVQIITTDNEKIIKKINLIK